MDEGPYSEKMPLKRAFLWVLMSVMAVSGTATFGWLYYLHWKESLISNPQYTIRLIAQTSPPGVHLDTEFFAEVLGLSRDRPTNLYAFNVKEGERRLNRHPVIKRARVQALPPESLHIDYEVRVPVAYLGDFMNVAVDDEKVMIPFLPFFTPKRLPKLYLGLDESVVWGERLTDSRLKLGHAILEAFRKRGIVVKSLDLSRLEAASYGGREIVATLEEANHPGRIQQVLRLNHLHPFDSIEAYMIYRERHEDISSEIIDLRIKDLAFIVSEKNGS